MWTGGRGRLTAGVGGYGQGGAELGACPDVGRLGGRWRFRIEYHNGSRVDFRVKVQASKSRSEAMV